ncbi:MAG: hypothetical protein ABR592_09450 [Nitriliruptorales bacterium]
MNASSAVAFVAMTAILGGAPTAASGAAAAKVSGTFYYTDTAAGNGSFTDPRPGVCYPVPTEAVQGYNDTDAVATTYADQNCNVGGAPVDPGNSATYAFGSVLFASP